VLCRIKPGRRQNSAWKGFALPEGSIVMSPFVSEAQRKWMYANHPKMAKRWQEHTSKTKKLPERKRKKR
jgi:hypothetical protein